MILITSELLRINLEIPDPARIFIPGMSSHKGPTPESASRKIGASVVEESSEI